MEFKQYQVSAFTSGQFSGNPAAVFASNSNILHAGETEVSAV